MPVTTHPSRTVGRCQDPFVQSKHAANQLLQSSSKNCEDPYKGDPSLPAGGQRRPFSKPIASSFDSWPDKAAVVPYENGFVHGILRAFNQDLHVELRPDDLWLTILVQFGFYVNGNADALRKRFVSHEGRRSLAVWVKSSPDGKLDLRGFAREMTGEIGKNVADPTLREWMTPNFTTTTEQDMTVASWILMGSMKGYFEYPALCGGAFPSVTLQGERSDWENIARRIEKLNNYGRDCEDWVRLLRPILRYFLLTFDNPDSTEVNQFWMRTAFEAGPEGSANGIKTLSGWITAFAYFSGFGAKTKSFTDKELSEHVGGMVAGRGPARGRLNLEGVEYPIIRLRDLPKGVVTLPVIIKNMEARTDTLASVLVGQVGMRVTGNSKMAPLSGWWVTEQFTCPIDTTDKGKAVGAMSKNPLAKGASGVQVRISKDGAPQIQLPDLSMSGDDEWWS